jgi:hypothetical protein
VPGRVLVDDAPGRVLGPEGDGSVLGQRGLLDLVLSVILLQSVQLPLGHVFDRAVFLEVGLDLLERDNFVLVVVDLPRERLDLAQLEVVVGGGVVPGQAEPGVLAGEVGPLASAG